MATVRWTPRDANRAQVNTITPANVAATNTFTVTINNKSVTFTATGTTVAEVTAGLVALIQASPEGEFQELTAADITTALTLTANTGGKPFTQTSSAGGGTATLVTSTTMSNISSNDVSDATNWSTAATPANTNDLILDVGGSSESLLYNLGALSAITLNSLTRRFSFTGSIALDELDQDGTTYWEYRATEFAISATTEFIEQSAGDGLAQIKRNQGTVQTALTVLGTGGGSLGSEGLFWRGTHASNVVNVINGSIALGILANAAYTVATLTAENSVVRAGPNGTLTTVALTGGTAEFACGCTTLKMYGGAAVTTKGTAAITTADVYSGTLTPQSNSTNGTILLGPNGAGVDWSQGVGAVTVTNQVVFPAGAIWNDPQGRVTLSGGYKFADGVSMQDCPGINMGVGRTHTVS